MSNPGGSTGSTPLSSSSKRGGTAGSASKTKKRFRFTPNPSLPKWTDFECLQGTAAVTNPDQYEVTGFSDFNSVKRSNEIDGYLLCHRDYSQDLVEFLGGQDVFDNLYTKYRDADHTGPVYHPTDSTRVLMLEVIKTGFDFIDSGSGGSLLPENIGIYLLKGAAPHLADVMEGKDWPQGDYTVVLLPTKKSLVVEQDPFLLGECRGLADLKKILFDCVLKGVNIDECSPDIQHLHGLMSGDLTPEKRALIASHPALMPIDDRMYYWENVWQKYCGVGARAEVKENIEKAAETALTKAELGDWRTRIPKDTPIEKIYNKNSYGTASGFQLLRFLRILGYHRNDPVNEGFFEGGRNNGYRGAAYLEMRLNHIFPLFQCHLHEALYRVGITIC